MDARDKLVVGAKYVFRKVVIDEHDVVIAAPRNPADGATIFYLDPAVLDLFDGLVVTAEVTE